MQFFIHCNFFCQEYKFTFYFFLLLLFYLDAGSFHSVMGSLTMLFLFDYALI